MTGKTHSSFKHIMSFARALIWLVLLVALVLFFNILFASRASPADKQLPESISGASRSSPTLDMSRAATTESWNTYEDTTHGYSFKYPSDWTLTKGNDRDASLPRDAVAVEKGRDYTVIIAVEPIRGTERFTSNQFKQVSALAKTSAVDTVINGWNSRRIELIIEGMEGIRLKSVYTFFPVGDRVYYLYTIYPVDAKTEQALNATAIQEQSYYDLIVASFHP